MNRIQGKKQHAQKDGNNSNVGRVQEKETKHEQPTVKNE